VLRRVADALLYFPEGDTGPAPAGADDVEIGTRDGVRLHGWWFAAGERARAHVLLCHGNGGNVRDRIVNARLLTSAGFDVLVFDYRGYGRSDGRAHERGTYEDARAARAWMEARADVDPGRVLILGESLGGAVALKEAVERPPAGLILQSAFKSVREMAAVHYGSSPAPSSRTSTPASSASRGCARRCSCSTASATR